MTTGKRNNFDKQASPPTKRQKISHTNIQENNNKNDSIDQDELDSHFIDNSEMPDIENTELDSQFNVTSEEISSDQLTERLKSLELSEPQNSSLTLSTNSLETQQEEEEEHSILTDTTCSSNFSVNFSPKESYEYFSLQTPLPRFELKKSLSLLIWCKLINYTIVLTENYSGSIKDKVELKELENICSNIGYTVYIFTDGPTCMMCAIYNNEDNESHAVISFRGTQNPTNIISDLDFITSKTDIHKGFETIFTSLWDKFKDSNIFNLIFGKDTRINKLYITGHSLGGALAILSIRELMVLHKQYHNIKNNTVIYTFAAPRVVTKRHQETFDTFLPHSIYSIIKHGDIIPQIPVQSTTISLKGITIKEKALDYSHVGHLILVKSDSNNDYIYNDYFTKYKDILSYFKTDEYKNIVINSRDFLKRFIDFNNNKETLTRFTNKITLYSKNLKTLLESHFTGPYLTAINNLYIKSTKKEHLWNDEYNIAISSDWFTDIKKEKYARTKFITFQQFLCGYIKKILPKHYQQSEYFEKYTLDTFDSTFLRLNMWNEWFIEEYSTLTIIQQFFEEYGSEDNITENFIDDNFKWIDTSISPVVHIAMYKFIKSVQNVEDINNILAKMVLNLPGRKYKIDYKKGKKNGNLFTSYPIIVKNITHEEQLSLQSLFYKIYCTLENENNTLKDIVMNSPNEGGKRLSTIKNRNIFCRKMLSLLENQFISHDELLDELQNNNYVLSIILNNKIISGRPTQKFIHAQQNKINRVKPNVWKLENNDNINLHIKEYPSNPGLDRAYFNLSTLLYGYGSAPNNCIGKLWLPNTNHLGFKCIPLLLSETIGEEDLDLNNCLVDERIPLNLKRYSELYILSLILLPGDDTYSNFKATKISNEYILYSIDNDQILSTSKNALKSIIFCLKERQQQIHEDIKLLFKYLDYERIVENWLYLLSKEDKLVKKLFSEAEMRSLVSYEDNNNNSKSCILRVQFRHTMLQKLYNRLKSIFSIIKHNNELSHEQLCYKVIPITATKYYSESVKPSDTTEYYKYIQQYFHNILKKSNSNSNITTKTPSSIKQRLGEGKIKDYPFNNSVKKQLQKLKDWKNMDKNTEILLLRDKLKDNDNFKKHFKKEDPIIQEHFLLYDANDILELYTEEERKIRETSVLKAISSAKNYTIINLSNYISDIDFKKVLKNHKNTLQKLVLKNTNCVGKWLYANRIKGFKYLYPALLLLDITDCTYHSWIRIDEKNMPLFLKVHGNTILSQQLQNHSHVNFSSQGKYISPRHWNKLQLHGVESINLRGCIEGNLCNYKENIIKWSENLKTLKLCRNKIRAPTILDIITKLNSLDKLCIGETNIFDSKNCQEFTNLINTIFKQLNLSSLTINGNNIDDKGLNILLSYLTSNKSVRALDISTNNFSDEGIKKFFDFVFSKDCNLDKLKCNDNNLNTVFNSYNGNDVFLNVRKFCINNNNLDKDSVPVILQMITKGDINDENSKNCIKLTNLSINNSSISRDNIVKIISQAQITELSIENFSSTNQETFLEFDTYHLEILNISNNTVTPEFIQNILGKGKNLRTCIMDNISLSSKENERKLITNILNFLKTNRTLLKLSLKNNGFIKQKDISTLNSNASLCEIQFS